VQFGGKNSPIHWGVAQRRIQKKFPGGQWWETHFWRNDAKQTWIDDDVERETAGSRKHLEFAEAVVQQKQEEMEHTEITGLTNWKPKKTFEESFVAIWDSLSDLSSYDDEEDGEKEDDAVTKQGKLSQDDEPGWVIGTITTIVWLYMERFRPNQMMLDELTQPGWEYAADYFSEWDKK
jgi:hypothetical protein